jgi:hypothetical protein
MKSKFDEFNQHRQPDIGSKEVGMRPDSLGNTHGDCFELLSAYLDGEVTASERQQVQQWLDTEPQIQQLYTRLLRLQQAIPRTPLPPAAISPQQLSEGVFQAVGRHRRRRFALWGGVTAATLVAGLLSHLLIGNNSLIPKMVTKSPPANKVEAEPLMIALHQPVLDIPPLTAEDGTPPSQPASHAESNSEGDGDR